MKHLAFLFVFLLLVLAMTGCQSIPSTGTEVNRVIGSVEQMELKDGSKLYFPLQPASDSDQMEALLEGQLVLNNGCLRAVTGGYEQPGFLILWPSDAGARPANKGIVEVLDSSGQIVGRVGEPIRIAGGAMENESTMALWENQIDGLPVESCPGPYWVAGTMHPITDVAITETAQPLATPYAEQPTSGICSEAEGTLVSVFLRPDVPDPRCVRVKPDQHLSVKNETDQTLLVSIAHIQAELGPGEQVTFDTPFGEYLMPGVHLLSTSAPPGGSEIWLDAEQPSS